MAKLTRATQKIFAKDATSTQVTAFGTAKLDSPTYTKDVSQIMNANFEDGWNSAILEDKAPYEEDDNGINYAMTRQLAYLYQEGIPEYDSATEYCSTSVVKAVEGGKVVLYHSLADGNVGNALSDTTKWEEVQLGGNTRCIGEIVTSTIPLSDAGLHLLDGTLISGSGIYADFVTYIAGIYNSSLNYFCTEAQWQASVSQYGVCGKFVYNSTNNTVRLPKVTGFIEGASGTSTLGNLTQAGLPNHSHTISLNGRAGDNAGSTRSASWCYDDWVGGVRTAETLEVTNNSIYGNSTTVQPQSVKVLYYIVVATTTKTDIEVDIDEIATDLNGKANIDLSNCTKPYVTATYVNGTSWWRLWSDKWCEQGGKATTTSSSVANMEVTFLKPYANNNYFVVQQHDSNNSTDMSTSTCAVTYVGITSKASTGFRTSSTTSFTGLASFYWYACGYIS